MLIPVKEFYTNSTPTFEELQEAHNIVINEKCVVHLNWFIPYNGWNDRYIYEDTDIDKLNLQLRNIVYGI